MNRKNNDTSCSVKRKGSLFAFIKRNSFACISFFLIFVLLMSSTYAWFTIQDSAKLKFEPFAMESSTGLRVNEGEAITNVITVENVKLSEASSVDGRNIYFPTSTNVNSCDTLDMKFREGSVGDQNTHYVYKNFTLTGDSEFTNIFIKSYKIEVDDQVFDGGTGVVYVNGKPHHQVEKKECPIRIAFIEDSADTPFHIDPTAIVDQHAKNYNAIDSISSNGTPFLKMTDAKSFSKYYFGYNQPLVSLFGTESKEMTMVAWLECTANKDVCDRYAEKNVSITIDLESNFSDYDRIEFIDDTIGDTDINKKHWINSNGSCIVAMSYKDSDNVVKTVVMNAISDTHWYSYMPSDIKSNISFYRYSLHEETIFNSWHTRVDINKELSGKASGWLSNDYKRTLEESRGDSLVYTAKRGNGYGDVSSTDPDLQMKRLSPCIGFWNLEGGSEGGGGEPGGGESGGGSSIVSISLAINVIKTKQWMINDLRSGANFYAVIDGKEYKLTTNTQNYDFCKVDGLNITKGSVLTHFVLKNSYFTKTVNLRDGSITLDRNNNYNFKVNNSDQLEPN